MEENKVKSVDKEVQADIISGIRTYYHKLMSESQFVAFLCWMNVLVTAMVVADASIRIEQAFALMVFALGWAVYSSFKFYQAFRQFKAVKAGFKEKREESQHALMATNIKWDIEEGDEINLPESMQIPAGIVDEDEISDYLSDETGYCHKGFSIEKVSASTSINKDK